MKELALGMAGYRLEAADFERVVIEHQRRVLMTALRLLGNLEDARDAAQDVFLRLHKHIARFDADRDIAPWLYRMTVNVCFDLRRKRKETADLDIVHPAAPAFDPLADRELRERRAAVAKALLRLPEKERAAVTLRDIEGLSTSEVARILGSSEATVRSQISTARVKLARYLKGGAHVL
jgi:RNA polymerase sigma-70 factor (ECF subfamily)